MQVKYLSSNSYLFGCLICSCISEAILVSFCSFRVSSTSLLESKTSKTIVTFPLVLHAQYWLISSCILVVISVRFDLSGFVQSHYWNQRKTTAVSILIVSQYNNTIMTKGQLISKGLFDAIVSTKKHKKF